MLCGPLEEKGCVLQGWMSAGDMASHLHTKGLCCAVSLCTLGPCVASVSPMQILLIVTYRQLGGTVMEQAAACLNVTLYQSAS